MAVRRDMNTSPQFPFCPESGGEPLRDLGFVSDCSDCVLMGDLVESGWLTEHQKAQHRGRAVGTKEQDRKTGGCGDGKGQGWRRTSGTLRGWVTWQGRAALCAGRDRPGMGGDGCCGEAELRVLNSLSIETALEP